MSESKTPASDELATWANTLYLLNPTTVGSIAWYLDKGWPDPEINDEIVRTLTRFDHDRAPSVRAKRLIAEAIREQRALRGSVPDARVRKRGRPGWTAELFRQRYHEAVERTKLPVTPSRVADNFDRLDGSRGIDPHTLAKLRRHFGE